GLGGQSAGGDVGLEVLARQLVAELGPDLDRDLGELAQVDARLDAHAVEQVHDVFGRDVARGPRRVGAASEAAEGGVDGADAELQGDGDVGQGGAAGVVEVDGELVVAQAGGQQLAQDRRDLD